MIKIRYADLPGGLHVRAVARGKETIIYLLPGLTVVQRRAALNRVRSSARIGHGPELSAAGLTRAVAADRVRTTIRNAVAATRMHPAIFVPLIVIIVSAAVAYLLLMSVSVRVGSPQASGAGSALGIPVTVAPEQANVRRPRDLHGQRPALPGGPPASAGTPAPTHSGDVRPVASPSPSPEPTGAGSQPHPSPAPSATPSPSPSGSGSGSGLTSGSSADGHGGLCLEFGPTGVCLTV